MMPGSTVRVSTLRVIDFLPSAPPSRAMARQHLGLGLSLSPPTPSAICEYDHCNGIGAPLRC